MSNSNYINGFLQFGSDGGSIYAGSQEYSNVDAIDSQVMENILCIPFAQDVFFPYLHIYVEFHEPKTVLTIKKAVKENLPVFLFLAPPEMQEDLNSVTIEQIYRREGAFADIASVMTLEDEGVAVQFILGCQGAIGNLRRRSPYLRCDVHRVFPAKIIPGKEDKEIDDDLISLYWKLADYLSDSDKEALEKNLGQIPTNSVAYLNFIIQNSPLDSEMRYFLLTSDTLGSRRSELIHFLEEQLEMLGVRKEMHGKTIAEIGRRQREEYLRTQMQQIQKELGGSDDEDLDALRERAASKMWTEETQKAFDKELVKLSRYNMNSPEYAVQYSYIDTFLDLPWLKYGANPDISIEDVQRQLDEDHYGLEKVKERIVEQVSVIKLRGDMKAPIICLVGPPGVGKTSLGKSIAKALGREYLRVALGGVHDEAEIRGHRKTYLGSMPGRIIASLAKCGTSDPVMVLDEIDKLGADIKGDPSTALLEVLDPEQNCKFHDNYIDYDYDLSRVFFIATANSLSTISAPLLDRMEIIEVGGYIEAEKLQIAKRHLIRKSLKEHGFGEDEVTFSDDAIMEIINSYTRESGVRKLEKKINKVLRRLAMLKASGKQLPEIVDAEKVKELLGKPEVFPDTYENNDIPGIVTGLAWTSVGGEILFIESLLTPAKDAKLTLTGNLGDVMKESAMIAYQYLKANAEKFGIDRETLDNNAVHIHVPEGAVPKDGPSAGITILTSLASTFTGRKVRNRLAMTGEMTLRGKVLPVGGIREKILAAKRSGITTVMLSEKNRKDIEEINQEYLEGLEFHFVETAAEVLDFALLPQDA